MNTYSIGYKIGDGKLIHITVLSKNIYTAVDGFKAANPDKRFIVAAIVEPWPTPEEITPQQSWIQRHRERMLTFTLIGV